MHHLDFGGHLDLPFAGLTIGGYHVGSNLLDGSEEGLANELLATVILPLEAIRAGDAATVGR